jgi:hypothetical protein
MSKYSVDIGRGLISVPFMDAYKKYIRILFLSGAKNSRDGAQTEGGESGAGTADHQSHLAAVARTNPVT